jgi:hypothetical protein
LERIVEADAADVTVHSCALDTSDQVPRFCDCRYGVLCYLIFYGQTMMTTDETTRKGAGDDGKWESF